MDPAVCLSYSFRLVSAVSLHCPIIFSMEGHNFTVIASDGEYLQPVENVSSLTLANGERFDILIDVSNHKEKSYVMRFAGSPGEFANCKALSAIAFLQYGHSPVDQTIEPDYEESISVPGKHVNPVPTVELPPNQKLSLSLNYMPASHLTRLTRQTRLSTCCLVTVTEELILIISSLTSTPSQLLF